MTNSLEIFSIMADAIAPEQEGIMPAKRNDVPLLSL